ncbi:MAG: hypothetical protein R6X29_10830 [Acidimicrobiia bacterium]
MDALLRLVHIGAGVVWAGGAFMTAWFILPAATIAGPAAGPFMGALTGRTKITQTMVWASTLTVGAGLVMWARLYGIALPGGFRGAALVVGSVAGLAALGVGHGVQSPTAKKMAGLGAAVAAAGAPPTADQAAELDRLRSKMGRTAVMLGWLMVAAVAGMALGGS